MFEEIIHGIYISDIETSQDINIYNKYNIKVVLNCTINGLFITGDIQKVRIPLTNTNNDIILLKKHYNSIMNVLESNFLKNNILICCSNGLCISPIIVGLLIHKLGNITTSDISNILNSKNKNICLDYDLSQFIPI